MDTCGQVQQERSSWPELIGKTFQEASEVIKKSCPSVSIHCVDKDAFVTMDFRTDRVRVYVDDKGIVVTAPTIG